MPGSNALGKGLGIGTKGIHRYKRSSRNKVKTGSKGEVRVLLVDFGGQKLVTCSTSTFYSMDSMKGNGHLFCVLCLVKRLVFSVVDVDIELYLWYWGLVAPFR